MKASTLLSALVAGVLALPCLAQNDAKQPPKQNIKLIQPKKPQEAPAKKPEDAKPKADPDDPMTKYGTPGNQHLKLEAFIGEWEGQLKMWGAPGAEPQTSKTKATIRMDMDGRYLRANHTGEFEGAPFRGQSVWGYNNLRKQYESTWIDSMSTGIMFSTGQADAAGRVFTFTGEADDPMSGKTVKEREVATVIDDDTWKLEAFRPGTDGKEARTMEIVFKRIAGTRKPGPGAIHARPAKDGDKQATPTPAAPK